MRRRVVITGMGWVTPLGASIEGAWARLLASESAIGPLTRFPGETFATNFAAEVRDFDLADHAEGAALRFGAGGCLSTGFAVAAAAQAVEQSGLGRRDGSRADGAPPPHRVGVYLGAGEGSPDYPSLDHTHMRTWDAQARATDAPAWARAAAQHMAHAREFEQEPHATLARVAGAFGAQGPSLNCMTACAAGVQAIGEAAEIIARGDADAMLAGGAHSMIHPLGMTGFIRLTAMSTRRDTPQTAARPFDRTRDGFVMGEGAGVVVLESLEHAERRGAEPLAEIAGYGSSADAFRITDMHPEGAGPADAMERALRQAGITPAEPGPDNRPPVDYICAHGTGTKENDSIETTAIKRLFGPQASRIPVSSIKSMMGHLIQAAGAVELIACVQAIRTGWLPPTINVREPDPACDLDVIPNTARDLRDKGGVGTCLTNSFGFGGQNDSVLVRRT